MVSVQAVEQPLKGLVWPPSWLPPMLYSLKVRHSNQVKRGLGFE